MTPSTRTTGFDHEQGASLPDHLAERISALRTALADPDLDFAAQRAHIFDLGLAWPTFPEGLGGMGLTPEELPRALAELGALGTPATPPQSVIGVGMAAPTIMAFGTATHQARLRPLYVGEELWCQLFSEPGAGSDLANVSTSAVRDGDQWIIKGEKVWTSLAHEASWGLLLARTDPDAPKHAGLTFFIVPMDSPGIEVLPLYQLTGEAEFNQVRLDGLVLPDAYRLGEVGDGWRVALTTLTNERGALAATSGPGADPMEAVIQLWAANGDRDPDERSRLVRLWIRNELLKNLTRHAPPGKTAHLGPVGKILWAECTQDMAELCLDLLGAEGLEYPYGYPMRRPDLSATATAHSYPHYRFLRSRANSIEGGTSEVMRTIIGERVLGLEPEPRVDKTSSWKETRRG
ncbi:acyl-CoA dehydrogenase family protein [Nocardioides sp. AE5]|uniref:acyl-CoA dehydrogenase family protein n=1 Tax=Nocardioides sp. AE5 TaxID=2962573 RepID=UPI0028824F94|nr:acyl-CoA dehydrogenase family protein [Nocardioides sp. AE5]MDT0203189.1 acyl-CoA dehydrogenase family protein [Nocardioides sp. AE5]